MNRLLPIRSRNLGLAGLALAAATLAGVHVTAQQAQPGPPPNPAAKLYAETCAGCHGTTPEGGGRAPPLLNQEFLATRTDEQLQHVILNGVPDAEMPAFKDMLTPDEAWRMVGYLRAQAATLKGRPTFVADPDGQVIRSQKQAVRLEVVARGLETPWGLAFLPDGRLLVTERSGRLRIVDRHGRLLPEPVKGTPTVWVRQDAGLMDVAVHPDYRRNGWIYLSYVELAPGHTAPPETPGAPQPPPGARPPSPPSMTVVIRGKLNARNEWVQTQEIFRAPASLYTPSTAHYGSRLVFDKQGRLFFSVGDRGVFANAQDLKNPLGKVHRVNDDGSVPKDNPFVSTPGAVPTIWSYGHRNPQGFAWDPVTGLLWESEHGPTGGDEINIIEKGKNYGWGLATMGVQPGISQRTAPGTEPPITYYTPVIAPSGIHFYTGARYPGWKNSLFVAALAGQHLRRLEISGRQITAQEVVFQQFGRTRAVTTGPDGLLYVLLQNPTGAGTGLSLSSSTPGMVVRLAPVD